MLTLDETHPESRISDGCVPHEAETWLCVSDMGEAKTIWVDAITQPLFMAFREISEWCRKM
jgi:hypothetical protein